eukprot:TRINITY_DN2705_c0_g1_i1.p1 TRINITY_DN2705_c0_g1~~TRINITY_DN2705_c0_g1_i1.p1  ORF type:complete len:112 (+),score=2.02 TRINITY_DN2705_c0_g1_i1:98-433(+)
MSVPTIFQILILLFWGAFSSVLCEPGYDGDYNGGFEICQPSSFDEEYGFCAFRTPGTYQPQSGQTECIPCALNKHTLFGATECVPCPEVQTVTNTNTCGTCPAGEYMAQDG